jgi:hypothetical protein
MLSFWTDADHYAEDAEPDDHSVLTIAGLRTCERPTAWLRWQDSNLCIVCEFAKTLSLGREDSNLRISIEVCRAAPHSQRKSQAMVDRSGSDSEM